MSATIPDAYLDLLNEAIVVTLTTVSAEGAPYSVAVWCRWDGEHLLITSDAGTRKHRNVLANPQVSVLALDPRNPYRYVSIGGTAAIVTENVVEELDRQTLLYKGEPHYFGSQAPVEEAASFDGVILKIHPARVVTFG
jgi:PPOX class probable F420-dependent enzyme